MANPNLAEEDADGETFALMELSSRDGLREVNLSARTDEEGNLWLYMGSDAVYSGYTLLYYDAIEVTLTPLTG